MVSSINLDYEPGVHDCMSTCQGKSSMFLLGLNCVTIAYRPKLGLI